jgi:hypothetical protein
MLPLALPLAVVDARVSTHVRMLSPRVVTTFQDEMPEDETVQHACA